MSSNPKSTSAHSSPLPLAAVAAVLVRLLFAAPALAAGAGDLGVERTALPDFGVEVEQRLAARAPQLFGVMAPLATPAGPGDYVPRRSALAGQRLLLAPGLHADFVTRRLAAPGDQMVLWPPAVPTHLVLCIERPRAAAGGLAGANPSLQRVDLATGGVTTMLFGLASCDGLRATPWGTLLVTEESGGGRAWEIMDPLHCDGQWVADRATGDVRTALGGALPSDRVALRPALPTMAWEGLAVLPGGVVLGGDELRPGETELGRDGGAIYKFVPDAPLPPGGPPIDRLASSPLVAGRTFALSVSCWEPASPSFPQPGEGCDVGVGAWVEVDPTTARADAAARGATGRYRPEDLDLDPLDPGPGVRFCWADTGRREAGHFAEVLCAVDPAPLPASPGVITDPRSGFRHLADGAALATVEVRRFLAGDLRFNSFDNLAFQPGSGNLYVLEDQPYGEVWACLPDGDDRDLTTDGCLPIAAVADPRAEPTGWIFDARGEVAYLVLQHGESPPELLDFASNPLDGTTDDLLRITGFATRNGTN